MCTETPFDLFLHSLSCSVLVVKAVNIMEGIVGSSYSIPSTPTLWIIEFAPCFLVYSPVKGFSLEVIIFADFKNLNVP